MARIGFCENCRNEFELGGTGGIPKICPGCGSLGVKYCRGCSRVLRSSNFNKNSQMSDGLQPRCQECCRKKAKREHLKRTYNLTEEEYWSMIEEQGGGCAICGRAQTGKKKLPVDHDHDTGATRQVLCGGCNIGLGGFQDNPVLLFRAIEYLLKHGKTWPVSAAPRTVARAMNK